ncbi:MAG: hypothetical protein WA196_07805, partial [Pseudolabrys sp.]
AYPRVIFSPFAAKSFGRDVNAQNKTGKNKECWNWVKNRDEGHGDSHCGGNPNVPRDRSKQGVHRAAPHRRIGRSSPRSPEADGNISQAFEDYHLARAIFHSPVGARPIRRPSTPKVN